MKKVVKVVWEELKHCNPHEEGITKEQKEFWIKATKSGIKCGPRFHPRFSDATVVSDDGFVLVLEKEAKNKTVAENMLRHLSSWGIKGRIK